MHHYVVAARARLHLHHVALPVAGLYDHVTLAGRRGQLGNLHLLQLARGSQDLRNLRLHLHMGQRK